MINIFKKNALYNDIKGDIVPLGFPILSDNRDEIIEELKKKKIFCPIHWKLPSDVDKKEFHDSWRVSNRILTIPITKNFNKEASWSINVLKEKIR